MDPSLGSPTNLGSVAGEPNFTRSSEVEPLLTSSLQPNDLDDVGVVSRNSLPLAAQVADDPLSQLDAESVNSTSSTSQDILINFQPNTSVVPLGYIKDIGDAYDNTRGFGWVRQDTLGTACHAQAPKYCG